MRAEIRPVKGSPRLFLNDRHILPLWAMSAGLLKTIPSYKASGIDLYSVILGLNSSWHGPQEYDFSNLDRYLGKLLGLNPNAVFLPRLQLNAPRWWEDAYPNELIRFGIPVPEEKYQLEEELWEGGFNWKSNVDPCDPSLASDTWIAALNHILRAYLRHIENSPLRSRIMGFHLSSAMTAEWHYSGSTYLPDYSQPMAEKIGPIPSVEERIHTTHGLFRNPEKEQNVIDFYRKFHRNTADLICHFASITKEETQRRILCGVFYAYVMENVMIQEAGHLAPEPVLDSPDIDFIASPYAYMYSNIPGKGCWESDIVDEAGNWLGRARGEGGDGGYRVPIESIKRRNKLFIVEWDPSTYLEPARTSEGGSGSNTVEGTLNLLRRDMSKMFAAGVGGWFLDFGHFTSNLFQAGRGWYDDPPIINEIKNFTSWSHKAMERDVASPANTLVLVDYKSFFVTQHWLAEEPCEGYGMENSDIFNHWFLNAQARTWHRIGVPVDFLFRSDLKKKDLNQYRLVFLPNAFYLTDAEVAELKSLFRDSGATVVWYYAPGYVAENRLSLDRMERLTGFSFQILQESGPMFIETTFTHPDFSIEPRFGIKKAYSPRFAVEDPNSKALGVWEDRSGIAFAEKNWEGFRSIYVGSAPLPIEILRWVTQTSGVSPWSSRPDIVTATKGATSLVATSSGERTLALPLPQQSIESGRVAKEHHLNLQFGEVRNFVAT